MAMSQSGLTIRHVPPTASSSPSGYYRLLFGDDLQELDLQDHLRDLGRRGHRTEPFTRPLRVDVIQNPSCSTNNKGIITF